MKRRAISRLTTAIVAVIVIVIIVTAGTLVLIQTKTTSTQSLSSSSLSASTSAGLPNTLVVDEPDTFDSLDPTVAVTPSGLDISVIANLGLLMANKTNYNQFIPVLATSWIESSDGLTYTFSLQKNAYYSNGDPFNAYVVWYNIYRDMLMNQAEDSLFFLQFNSTGVSVGDVNSLNNPENTPNSTLLQVMENPHNSVTVIDPYTVQFHLAAPLYSFLLEATVTPWNFIDPFVVEQHGGVVVNQPNTWMSLNGSSVGNGPYITSAVVPNQYVQLVANPHYWAQNMSDNFVLQPAHIQHITINFKPDELTRELDLEHNVAQVAVVSFPDIADVLKADSNLEVPNAGPSTGIDELTLNSQKAPLSNLLVRRAIVAAINVTEVQQVAYGGYAIPVVGPAPSGTPEYNSTIRPPAYDVTLAEQLLVQAGYPNGHGLPPLDYLYATGPYSSLIAQTVQANLAQIGVRVNPRGVTIPTFYSIIYGSSFSNSTSPDIIENEWSWWPDFTGYSFVIDNQLGFFQWFKNSTINSWVAKANSEMNPAQRMYDISETTLLLQQQAAFIWLGQYTDFYNPGVAVGNLVWNKCAVGGLYFSMSWFGVPYNSASYTCVPS